MDFHDHAAAIRSAIRAAYEDGHRLVNSDDVSVMEMWLNHDKYDDIDSNDVFTDSEIMLNYEVSSG